MKLVNTGSVKMNKYTSDAIQFSHLKTFESPDNFDLHISAYCEAYIYVSGNASYIVEGNCYNLKMGDIIVLKPNEVHKVLLEKEDWYERFYILFPLDGFNYMENISNPPLNCFLNRSPGKQNIISLPDKERGEVMSLLYKISNTITNPGSKLLIYSYLLRFLHLLNYYYNCEINPSEIAQNDNYVKQISEIPQILKNILNYINNNLLTINSIQDIADHFYISLPYLSSLFKKHLNVNISNYVQVKKIALSKILLENGCSVTQACYDSGFNNCSYFISTFKNIVGMTPLKYKNSFISTPL